jgi:hypothetical protein
MFCSRCGRQYEGSGTFCESCGVTLVEAKHQSGAPTGTAAPWTRPKRSRWFWILLAVFVGSIVLAPVVTVLFDKTRQTESTGTTAKPTLPPPKFRVFRQEAGRPVSVVVAHTASDEDLRSLLWLFREKVRERRFSELGLKKEAGPASTGFSAGMIDVFRDVKYANEPFTRKEGEATRADAIYGWGLDRVSDHDQAFVKGADGSSVKVFDYSDNWQLPVDEQQRVDAEKKAADRCTTEDPMAKFATDMVLSRWENGSSAAQFWVGGVETQRLFAVKEHEFMERYYVEDRNSADGQKPNSSAFKFRIESSTQGGFPITKDWYIDVTLAGEECKVYKVEEAD